jgi:hypothetical protein
MVTRLATGAAWRQAGGAFVEQGLMVMVLTVAMPTV